MDKSRKKERKKQILNAALLVLVEKGYENSRIDDIVVNSGLSKGAIYWYNTSKKEVYLDLINFWVEKYSALINHIVQDNHHPNQQIKDLFEYFADQFDKDPEPFQVLSEFWSMSRKDEDFKLKLQWVYSNFQLLIKSIIEDGIKTGDFEDIDVNITSLSILVNIESIMVFTLFDPNGVTPRKYFELISDFILEGIKKR